MHNNNITINQNTPLYWGKIGNYTKKQVKQGDFYIDNPLSVEEQMKVIYQISTIFFNGKNSLFEIYSYSYVSKDLEAFKSFIEITFKIDSDCIQVKHLFNMIRSKPQYTVLEGLYTNGKAFARVNDNKRIIEVFKPTNEKREINYKSIILTLLYNMELLSPPMQKLYKSQIEKTPKGFYIRKGYKTINQFLNDYDNLFLTQRQFRALREANGWIYKSHWDKKYKRYITTFFVPNNTK